ncbi:MAG: hypothetical protein QXR59_04945 [Candidatus Bathyarchaeia archaeon]
MREVVGLVGSSGIRKRVGEQIKNVKLGDLVRVEWFDASIGRSLASGVRVDVPVRSWGIFVGLLGERKKHIVLAQNSFKYSDGLYDVDYTSIPLSWATEIKVVGPGEVPPETADLLLKSFLAGRCRTIKRRTRNHAGVD